MDSLKNYLSNQFSRTFFVVFLPLFFIVTLVYFVRISLLTSQIKVNILELMELYLYFLPSIIFYTLPISFIVALSSLFIRLSNDNELTALYSLGVSSKDIVLRYFKLAVLFSSLLLVVSLLGMPIAKQEFNVFKTDKLYEAKLNFTPSSLGQKFGDYYLYIEKQVGNKFENIVIFSKKDDNSEQIFVASGGLISKDRNGRASFNLLDGYGYTHNKEKNLLQAKYDSLKAFDTREKESTHIDTIKGYWLQAKTDSEIKNRLMFFIFVGLIPILSLFLISAFSMINPRYQGNKSIFVVLIVVVSLYAFASILDSMGTIYILITGVILSIWGGKWLFSRRVERYF